MIAVAVLAGVVALNGNRLRRIEGFVLLGAYPIAILDSLRFAVDPQANDFYFGLPAESW